MGGEGDAKIVYLHGRCVASKANMFFYMGRASEALLTFNTAMELFERAGSSLGILSVLCDSSAVYDKMGQQAEGLARLERADTLLAMVTGDDSSCAYFKLHILQNRAVLQEGSGDNLGSLGSFQAAYLLAEKYYGLGSSGVASSMANLGSAHIRVRQLAKAVELLTRALALFRRLGMSETPQVATVLANVGKVAALFGHFRDALSHLNDSLSLSRRIYPRDHPFSPIFSGALASISKVHGLLGRQSEALGAAAESGDMMRRLQTACAGRECARKLKLDGAPLDQCAGCLRTYYCSRACQTADWKAGHKASAGR